MPARGGRCAGRSPAPGAWGRHWDRLPAERCLPRSTQAGFGWWPPPSRAARHGSCARAGRSRAPLSRRAHEMRSSVIEVSGLFSALCAQGVEKRLRELPGVERAAVSYVTGTATVAYDETQTDLQAIKARIGDCGYHCSGEVLPKHVCRHDNPTAVAT